MCNHTIGNAETINDDECDDSIIRAKWQMDGAKTLDEAVTKLQRFIEHLEALKNDGWELTAPIDDDYGFIRKQSVNVAEDAATS